jgi:hypothetical protein
MFINLKEEKNFVHEINILSLLLLVESKRDKCVKIFNVFHKKETKARDINESQTQKQIATITASQWFEPYKFLTCL